MRIKEGYKVREIAGEYIIINQGTAGVDFTKVISLNSTSKFLFEAFSGKEFTVEDVADELVGKYGIGPELAAADAQKWADGMAEADVLE